MDSNRQGRYAYEFIGLVYEDVGYATAESFIAEHHTLATRPKREVKLNLPVYSVCGDSIVWVVVTVTWQSLSEELGLRHSHSAKKGADLGTDP
jgi:hypothetical protein